MEEKKFMVSTSKIKARKSCIPVPASVIASQRRQPECIRQPASMNLETVSAKLSRQSHDEYRVEEKSPDLIKCNKSLPKNVSGGYLHLHLRRNRSVHSTTAHKNLENDSSILKHSEGSTISLKRNAQTNNNGDNCTAATGPYSITIVLPEHVSQQVGAEKSSCSFIRFAKKVADASSGIRAYFMCPICSEPFNMVVNLSTAKPGIIACGHLFCMRCIHSWFEDQDSCPCCRFRILVKEHGYMLQVKEFPEVSNLLASIFMAGNFNTYTYFKEMDADDELLSYDLDKNPQSNKSLLLCKTTKRFLANHVAPIIQQILHQNQSDVGKDSEFKNCLSAAIWFLRHALTLPHPPLDSQKEESQSNVDAIPENLPAHIKSEALDGSESSREILLKSIMTKKPRLLGSCLSIPRINSTVSSLRRKFFSTPTIRMRTPSFQGITKMCLATFGFLMIALTLHISESEGGVANSLGLRKMDIFVFALGMFSMLLRTGGRIQFARGHEHGPEPRQGARRGDQGRSGRHRISQL